MTLKEDQQNLQRIKDVEQGNVALKVPYSKLLETYIANTDRVPTPQEMENILIGLASQRNYNDKHIFTGLEQDKSKPGTVITVVDQVRIAQETGKADAKIMVSNAASINAVTGGIDVANNLNTAKAAVEAVKDNSLNDQLEVYRKINSELANVKVELKNNANLPDVREKGKGGPEVTS